MTRTLRISLLLVLGLLAIGLLAAGCGSGEDDDGATTESEAPATDTTETEAAPPPEAALELTSSAFGEGDELAVELTCDGAGDSPSLEWSGVPEGTESLALLLLDPDAPGDTPFLHASVIDIPPDVTSVGQGEVPAGGTPGPNETGGQGYIPPCPPEGDGPQRYVFSIDALSASVDPGESSSPAQFIEAIDGNSIAVAELTATYER